MQKMGRDVSSQVRGAGVQHPLLKISLYLMKMETWTKSALSGIGLGAVLAMAAFLPSLAAAATTNVTVGDDFFSPSSVTIRANDQVTWSWTGNINHSSTSTQGLWDSGVHGKGNSFSHTFPTAGSFPYLCTVHSSIMTGKVTVQAPVNVPPTVTITAPANGSIFAAPWNGTILASASDADGTVSKVDFFAGSTPLGTVSNPAANLRFAITNLGPGSYSLTAVATDNLGATNTSTAVSITVITPAPTVLGSPLRLSPTTFQFTYTANAGLTYLVQRSSSLSNWTPLSTNTAAGSPVTFLDNNASGDINFYSVLRLPNP